MIEIIEWLIPALMFTIAVISGCILGREGGKSIGKVEIYKNLIKYSGYTWGVYLDGRVYLCPPAGTKGMPSFVPTEKERKMIMKALNSLNSRY